MATAVLCDNLDIHSGVVDLAFPLHDNEIAQSEVNWQTRGVKRFIFLKS
jgi:cysteinyl-tRNA synthetase